MKALAPLLLLTTVAVVPAIASAGEEEWITLFNGRSLDGWTHQNGYATFRVEEGAIVGKTAEGSPNSFLCTTREFADFELVLDMKVDAGLNSGIQFRSRTKKVATGKGPNNAVGRVWGPQLEIVNNPARAGYLWGEATPHRWLNPQEAIVPHDHYKDDDWNTCRIIAIGPRIQAFLNGHLISDVTHEAIYKTHPSGFIGLQVHSDKEPLEVRWRNIRIREIKTQKGTP